MVDGPSHTGSEIGNPLYHQICVRAVAVQGQPWGQMCHLHQIVQSVCKWPLGEAVPIHEADLVIPYPVTVGFKAVEADQGCGRALTPGAINARRQVGLCQDDVHPGPLWTAEFSQAKSSSSHLGLWC